jgi:hypothetical protein
MANRSYLYSLNNRPTSYIDRPDTISGLSEWAYAVPFTYRVLVSGDPQLCSSLISDGFDGEPTNEKTKLYAISSDFESGFTRLKKFIAVLRPLAAVTSPDLTAGLDETVAFLEAHRDRYLLLETIELDCMTHQGEEEWQSCVEEEMAACLGAGAAIDALPADPMEAAECLENATRSKHGLPLAAFYGLRLDDNYDNVHDNKTEYPIGLAWSDVLYFELWNRARFEANR